VRDLAAAVVEGGDVALARARPGATCAEVEAAWQAVLRRHGFCKDSRVGYSIGLAFPPDWGERTMSLRPGDTTVLEPGMCFHFQSDVWMEAFGAAISEPFVVTDHGGERLCDVPRELIVID
jgi:ectoine hydrolase